jgi:hypothetical protein
MDQFICLQFREKMLDSFSTEPWEYLLKLAKLTAFMSTGLDMLDQQRLIRLTIQPAPARIGTRLPDEGVEPTREKVAYSAPSSLNLNDAEISETLEA